MRIPTLITGGLTRLRRGLSALTLAVGLLAAPMSQAAEPLRIGYSDWPGWVAWQVAIEKGWLKEAGIDAKFEWFDYSASMDAFSAGKLDAVTCTNGDALVMSGNGARNVMILLTDYSNGNDIIVGKPGVKSLADLKGKKVGLEVGLVEHLLLIDGLQKAGIKESEVTLVNAKTNETPQILASGDVAAIGAWQPIAGQAMRGAAGARPLYSSADRPGLIYDVVTVTPASLAARRADWIKLVSLWDRVVGYIADPKTQGDAVAIMAAKVGVEPAVFTRFLKGTKLLTLAEGRAVMKDADGFGSLYGSSRHADAFNVKFEVYKTPQDVKAAIDPALTDGK